MKLSIKSIGNVLVTSRIVEEIYFAEAVCVTKGMGISSKINKGANMWGRDKFNPINGYCLMQERNLKE